MHYNHNLGKINRSIFQTDFKKIIHETWPQQKVLKLELFLTTIAYRYFGIIIDGFMLVLDKM